MQPRRSFVRLSGMGTRGSGFAEGMTCGRVAETRADFTQCLQQPVKWALNTLPPLSSYAKSRVALVGDSVCFTPSLFMA